MNYRTLLSELTNKISKTDRIEKTILIVLIVVLWDGIVSSLRKYSVNGMMELSKNI